MGKTRHDWLSIQSEYTNAVPAISQADLCKKYGINPVTMCRKAKKENWEFQRDRFQTRLSEQKSENKAVAVATEGKAWDDRCLAMAKKVMDLADEEVAGHPIKDRKGNVIMMDGKPLLFKAPAKDVAAAIKMAQEVGKAALGDKPADPPAANLNVTLSLEDVVKKYADAGSSTVSPENGSR